MYPMRIYVYEYLLQEMNIPTINLYLCAVRLILQGNVRQE